MNQSDPFYDFQPRPDLSDEPRKFVIRIVDPEPSYARAQQGNGAAPVTFPFQLTDATEAGAEKVNIRFGMVGIVTPTGMDPVDGLTLAVTASGYVVLGVTVDGSGIATSATILILASVPADTPTIGKIALGYVTLGVDEVTCSQSVSSSLWHQLCGGSNHLFGSV